MTEANVRFALPDDVLAELKSGSDRETDGVAPILDGSSFLKQLTGEEEAAAFDQVIGLESTWQAKYYLRTNRYKFILSRLPDLLGNPDRVGLRSGWRLPADRKIPSGKKAR